MPHTDVPLVVLLGESVVMTQFTSLELESEELAKAWPLVRLGAPWLDLHGWQQSTEELVSRGGGVIAVVAPDGCFHGIATYERIDRQPMGRALFVGTFVTCELSRRAPVRKFLCDAIERLSAVFDCDAIAIVEPTGGYVPASWLDAHPVGRAPDSNTDNASAGRFLLRC